MGGLLHLVQRGRAWAGLQPAQTRPRCTIITNGARKLKVGTLVAGIYEY